MRRLNGLKVLSLILIMAGCRTYSPATMDSGLASSRPPVTGERKGKQASSRVTLSSTQDAEKTLAVRLWRHLDAAAAKTPELVGCKIVPGASPTRECATYDPATRADHLYCFAQSDTPEVFDPKKLDNIYCSFVSTAWPALTPYLANTVLAGWLDSLADASGKVVIGNKKTLTCNRADGGWRCEYGGFGDQVQDYLAERLVLRPEDFGPLTPPPGALDELGRPLPTSSATAKVQLGGGAVQARKYRADDKVLKRLLDYIPDQDEPKLRDHLENVAYTSKCREAEVFALMDYSTEGYKDVNSTLRRLAAAGDTAQPVEPTLDGRIRATVSAANCARKVKAGVVVRGATLSSEKLARYQPGAFVVEPAFTSTTIGEEVHSSFEGNVEFQIFDAAGVDLTDLSLLNEEGELELLFQAGTLFKVLAREQEGVLTVIKMVYIP